MKKRVLFSRSIGLVWRSTPFWTSVNIILSVLRSFLPLVFLFLVRQVTDILTDRSVAAGPPVMEYIIYLAVAIAVVYLVDELASEYGAYARRKQAIALESSMYDLLHSKAMRIDLVNFENPSYFDCLSRASREATWRPGNLLNNLVSVFSSAIALFLMAGVLFIMKWWLALLLILVNIPGIWLRLHFADLLYNFKKEQTPEARKAAYFNWLLTGDRPARELRLFGLGEYFRNLFRASFDKQKDKELDILKRRTAISTISILVKAAALLAAIIYLAGGTVDGTISPGNTVMILLAFRQGMILIRDVFSSVAGLYEDTLFISDTFEFLNLSESENKTTSAVLPGNIKDSLELSNITFSYPGSRKPVLDDISLSIKKGEIIALAGHNGAGKSTLVKLLSGLYEPDSGRILVDGVSSSSYSHDDYRRLFSVVFQDFMLYNLTAGENIRLGDAGRSDDGKGVREAAEATGIDKVVGTMPAGYNTVIGTLFDHSRDLSWGEWQKIAISRALYRDAPVLILDEPSSALDAKSEHEIFSRLRQIIGEKTAVLISHRFTNIMLADRIIVLDNGKVMEEGTHDQLMKKGGLYHNMFTMQSGRFSVSS